MFNRSGRQKSDQNLGGKESDKESREAGKNSIRIRTSAQKPTVECHDIKQLRSFLGKICGPPECSSVT